MSSHLHITLLGRVNSGKSSLINALTGQDVALVSPISGTTTDPVRKAMEIKGLGACIVIDTAGFDDDGTLGAQRIERTRRALEETDVAVLLLEPDLQAEQSWIETLKKRKIPFVPVLNKTDQRSEWRNDLQQISQAIGCEPVAVSCKTGDGIGQLRHAITEAVPKDFDTQSITGSLCTKGDLVMLVMPQDASAPKGRLILPQVQTIRELLDKGCSIVSCTPDAMQSSLQHLSQPPKLIITDSQAFRYVYEHKPQDSLLSSFSVLFAAYKGDIRQFVEGAEAFGRLHEGSRILIAEACTHVPQHEDIGRVKLPALLRKKYGKAMQIEIVSGKDFPQDLRPYDLIIHCGACMFNRRHVLNRAARAKEQQVAMTNYGIALAHLSGILEHVSIEGLD